MTRGFKFTLIWTTGTFVAMLMALNILPASLVDGQYIPTGNDSFYHARRILDAVADLSSFYEYDLRIHVPEGSLLTWPWGYDYLIAVVVKGAMALGLGSDPMKILAYIPVAALTITLALVVLICVGLEFSAWVTLLAVLCTALLPLNQSLNGVGIIDHHYVELIFTLATLWSGMSWLRTPDSRKAAILAGVVMGVAPAMQNGLFVLQLPLIIAAAILWLRNLRMPLQPTVAFGVTLVLTTMLVLLPSQPFREFRFEFYLLSWFHLYIAVCTAIALTLFAWRPLSRRSFFIVGGFGLLALLPLASRVLIGGGFVVGEAEATEIIIEAKSPYALVQIQGLNTVLSYYSLLLFLAPLSMAGCAWYCVKRHPQRDVLLFCVASLVGLLLLLMQYRMHVFGSYALYLPLLLLLDRASLPARRILVLSGVTVVLVGAYMPVRQQLFSEQIPGNDVHYALTRQFYPVMAEACRNAPGIVLAGSDAGHYIRFHTECSVIGDNFLLTEQHLRKFHELRTLMAMTPEQLLEHPLSIRYVYVSIADVSSLPPEARPAGDAGSMRLNPSVLSRLLFSDPETLPPNYRLLKEDRIKKNGVPYARLYEITHTETTETPADESHGV